MKKFWLFLSLFLLLGCGGRGVYLYQEKGDAARYDLDRPWVIIGKKGAGSQRLEKRLCQEKELLNILKEARLETAEQEALFEAACGKEASAVRFLQIYYGLEKGKRSRIRRSFERHGYSLNDYGC
ncbi:MAG TPA: hypothetical protein ENJ96_04915 [Thermodesulfatator atlanticus]|uniref:Lipoprotein n=1 Tax=Thermodesulfatator atlanticus TaxID=501497 RepID=A0A7V5P025_9BACT|nr:hypothetical protein [Thermodesulfatator atlanticus]